MGLLWGRLDDRFAAAKRHGKSPMNVKTVRYGSAQAARNLTESLLETGFAVLTDHQIPTQLIADTYS